MKIYYDENEKEVWKLIPNSKGYYVSNFGNIKRAKRKVWNPNNNSWNTIKEHSILPQYNNSKGYARVQIVYKNGKRITESVHRLVASEFVVNPNPTKFNQVNHLDLNIKNNHWRNLQWCTNQMNMDHSWKYSERRKLNHGGTSKLGIMNRKLSEEQVKRIPDMIKHMKLTDIAKEFNVGITTISEIIHGRSWKWLNLKFS